MSLVNLGLNVSASAAAAQAGVLLNATPFLAGNRQIIGILSQRGVTGTPTVLIQTSPDNATWTTQKTFNLTATGTDQMFEFQLEDQYARMDVSVAGTAGVVSIQLLPTSEA